MGIKGLRHPVVGRTRSEIRSAKHRHKVTMKAKGGSGGVIVIASGNVTQLTPLSTAELRILVKGKL